MTAMSLDPRLWPHLHPLLIAHDIGASRDRSTAVVGGFCRYVPGILGIKEFSELPQDLYGSARASALAQIDARYDRNALIFADLSNDSSYGEQMLETFGPRVIGVHGRHGNGTQVERRPVGRGCLPIYHVVVCLLEDKRGQLSRGTCLTISSSSLGRLPKSSIGAGTRPIPGKGRSHRRP